MLQDLLWDGESVHSEEGLDGTQVEGVLAIVSSWDAVVGGVTTDGLVEVSDYSRFIECLECHGS